MRKLTYALAAVATLALAAPSIANAQDVRVRIGGDRDREVVRDRGEFRGDREYRGVRAEFRGDRDRGWRRGRDRDRVVVIKRRHRDWD